YHRRQSSSALRGPSPVASLAASNPSSHSSHQHRDRCVPKSKIENRNSKITMAEREGLAGLPATASRRALRGPSPVASLPASNPGSHPSHQHRDRCVPQSKIENRNSKITMAEREGFEPPGPLPAQRFSSPPQSTTLPPLQVVRA